MKADTAIHSDIDALTALNRDYIHSVQHGDVRRLDETLAEDFLCSNPDGSLVDKNQFLAQTTGHDQWPLPLGTRKPLIPRLGQDSELIEIGASTPRRSR
jgi:hypothetical protein